MGSPTRVAMVTGAGKGIGQATALAFGERGVAVGVVNRGEEAGRTTLRLLEERGGRGAFVQADVSKHADAARAVREVVEAFGRLDVLVNNAGIHRPGTVLDTSEDAWDDVLRVNLTGAFLCAKYAAAEMVRQGGGVIINVASEAGLVAIRGQVAYNVSKAGMVMLTKSLAVDLAPHNIRANCVCPGTTETPLVFAILERASNPDAVRRDLELRRPQGRLGRPEEIAQAIVFLTSDACAYATGAVLSVDGGYTAQ